MDAAPHTPVLDPPPTRRPEAPEAPSGEGVGRRFRRHAYERAADERVNRASSIPFALVHVLALAGTLWFGITWPALAVFVVYTVGRIWFITAGYHRYFAHRAYRTSRAFQFILAFGATSSAQKGVLWWAGHHREHHRNSDTELDVHSPLRGFWWSHVGWILCDKYKDAPLDRIRDFAKYPEIRFIDKYDWIAPWTLGIVAYLVAGWPGLFFGFFLSTVVCWHNTFMINSVAHVLGRRRYATEDTSRNNWLLGISTLGEGWHNNHHYFQSSARNGFFWWEIDVTYYGLKVLSWLGIVRDLKVPSATVLAGNRIKDGAFDLGTFKANWARAAVAVANTEPTIGDRVRDGRSTAGAALQHRREAVEGAVAAKRDALETFVADSLHSAEELARLSRRSRREPGLVDG
jgi:stearoyl-CoA desaturase (delta-9 desaturase)